MAKSSLDTVEEQLDFPVAIEWKAFELRPKGAPPPDPSYVEMIKRNWPRVQAMGREYGVDMKTHRFGIDTRPAHRAFKIVQRLAPDVAEAFNTAIFRAYFEEDEDIGDTEVLVRLAEALDVDGDALREQLAADAALEAVLEEEYRAYQSGISGVPAMVFLDKYLLSGVRPPEQVREVIEQIREQERIAE